MTANKVMDPISSLAMMTANGSGDGGWKPKISSHVDGPVFCYSPLSSKWSRLDSRDSGDHATK